MIRTVLLATSFISVGTAASALPLQHGVPAGTILDQIGVDTHLEYNDGYGMYADSALVGSAMQYLGLRQVRDGVPTPGNSSYYAATQNFDILSNAPYDLQFELILSDDTEAITYDQGLLDDLFTTPARSGLAAVPRGAVTTLEGLNEINNEQPEPSVAQATAWQERIACLANSYGFCGSIGVSPDANVSGASVAEFTGNTSVIQPASQPSADFPATSGNTHPYVYANQAALPFTQIQQSFGGSYGFLPALVNSLESQPASPVGLVMSESGAASSDGGGDTPSDDPYYDLSFDDRTMAVRDLQTILDGVALDSRVFLYQLFANYSFAQSSDETYGLFRFAGDDASGAPTDTPTAAAEAIHNLAGTLAGGEASAQGTDCLEWNNPGAPPTEHTLLAQYGTGSFRIAIWNEGPDWDASTHSAVSQPVVNQSVTFGYPVSGYVLDAVTGQTSPFADTLAVDVALSDAPNVIVLTSANPNDGACSQ